MPASLWPHRPGDGGRAAILYAGVALFVVLAGFTARSVFTAWRVRTGEAKAEAVFDLVEQRTPSRPTEAPGAMAWLRHALDRYAATLAEERSAAYRSLAAGSDRMPAALVPLFDAVRSGARAAAPGSVQLLEAAGDDAGSLRRQRLVGFGDRRLVVTRRAALDRAGGDSDRFVHHVVPMLATAADAIVRALTARPVPAISAAAAPPRPVRIYSIADDGTLVSLAWPGTADAAERERVLLSGRRTLPAFAPQEFFFRFDRSLDPNVRAAYSGFYLDLGGRGLVATLLWPIETTAPYSAAVAALDLAFDVDWPAFAASVEPPTIGAAVTVAGLQPAATWPALETAAIAAGAPARLRSAVAAAADRERLTPIADSPVPLRHAVIDGAGALAAFHVSDSAWLLMLFPRTNPAFPVAAVVLLGGMLALLFAGFEVNRRRAEGQRRAAERALTEKQNLLNTMQIPLVVVDPNTDVIVSSNRAAEAVGVRAGRRFGDLVAPDPRSRAHYDRMQLATTEPRRAYGVPIMVPDDDGRLRERYAIVRSVAVTAPIEALAADERHRLGVLFLADRDADLALLLDDEATAARRDERRRLAGLLSHGVDTMARLLEHSLSRGAAGPHSPEFVLWLSEYLSRRITVSAWLLEHWDARPPLPPDSAIDGDQIRATLDRFQRILGIAQSDRDLRSRLHWDNGTLSAAAGDGRMLAVDLDWPASLEIMCPIRGGLGWFLGEVLANAVRHGAPGTTPQVAIHGDRVRREFAFRVQNAIAGARPSSRGEAYGGLAILQAMARLFDWRDFAAEADADGRFVVRWRVAASERGAAGDPD
jgi:PAS domain-containing protein